MYPDRRTFHLSRLQGREFWQYPRHRHVDFLEVVFVSEGLIEHHLCGEEVISRAGQLIFLGHRATHAVEAREYAFYNLNFVPEELDRTVRFLGLSPGQRRLLPGEQAFRVCELPIAHQQRLEPLFAELLWADERTERRLAFRRLLARIVSEFVLAPESQPGFRELPHWMTRLMETVEKRFSAELTVIDLSEIAGRSPAHLSRSFRRFFDTTPSAYLNRVRIHRAARLLAGSNLEISAVCYDVGFENLSYFYRLFKAAWGMTPAEYRHRHPRAGI